MYSIMISAGEASGDMHAANALQALRKSGVSFNSFGMGANQLQALGTELIVDCRELSVIGIVDVLINYPRFLKRLTRLRDCLKARRPDLLILVDYPDFNLKLAETARDFGIPVLFYISPQVWAWRSERVHRIGRLVDHMAVVFPFEVPFYENANVPVTYVGHPLVDEARCSMSTKEAREHLSLNQSKPVLTLLPGSRNGEVSRNLPIMLATADQVLQSIPDCQLLLPCAPTLDHGQLTAQVVAHSESQVLITDGDTYAAMRAADAALSASGTATLETAMIGTPMAIMYRIHALNYAVMKRMIRIDDIGLVNIVAGRRIVQEFVQADATPEKLTPEVLRLLQDHQYQSDMRLEFERVREAMGHGGASEQVASLIVRLLDDH